ncbi:MAG: BatA domain-containing protein [Planctomycetota bacterium]|nr:BatA domain-containing protein [Planctomycetota bacterium]
MVFLSPLYILGLLAVSVPLIIHLFYRRRVRNLRFSSLLLLRELVKLYSARQKLHEVLILLLRCAALSALAFALARPALKTSFLSSTAPSACAILLDNTYSMAYGTGALNRLTKAKHSIEEVLRTLSRRDSVALFTLTKPESLISAQDMSTLIEEVGKLDISYARPRIQEALDRASAFLRDTEQLNCQLVIIGDMQENTYREITSKEFLTRLPENTQLIFIDVGDEEAKNGAVIDVKTCQDFRRPQDICLEAKIQNFSNKELRFKPELSYGGQKRLFDAINLPPNGIETVRFYLSSSAVTKEKRAVFRVEEDGLDEDNRFYLLLKKQERKRVLLVNGDPSLLPEMDETFYLRIAIAPQDPATGSLMSDIEPVVIPYFQLERVKLSDYRAVVLANVQSLSNAVVKRLGDFVREGGGLVLFAGERVSFENYNIWLGDLAGVRLIDKKSFDEPLLLESVDFSHPIFGSIEAVAAETLPLLRFWRIVRTEPVAKNVNILATYSNGDGALFEYQNGKGRVIFLTTTCDRDWTNLPVRTVFLPLVQELLKYSFGESDEVKSYVTGDEIKVRVEGGTVKIKNPDGREDEPPVRTEGNERIVRFIPEIPGVFVLTDNTKEILFCVNASREESNLSRLAKESIPKGESIHYLESGEDVTAYLERMRIGARLWDYFLIAALCLLFLELLLSNRRLPSFKKEETR